MLRLYTGARPALQWWLPLALAILVTSATAVSAQQPTVVRVEENWELVVSDPNSYSDAPQVTCAISPVDNVDAVFANFEINHHTLPSFVAGGLQLQVWYGETPLIVRSHPSSASLSQDGETIVWTQAMEVHDGMLTFQITDGNSQAWGAFGADTNLSVTFPTILTNLNGYHPETSIANSGVGFAGNRVQSLTLKSIRVVYSDGQEVVDSQPRSVYVKN